MPKVGFKHLEESKRKIGESCKGNYHTEESKRIMSEAVKKQYENGRITWNKGKRRSKAFCEKISETNRKRKLSKESRLKIANSDYHKNLGGKNNPAWLGGISKEEYGLTFTERLKSYIRNKYGLRCQECFRHQDELYYKNGKKYKLHVHHIDFNKKNNSEDNLIPLCHACHKQTNFNRQKWINYYKERII
jgi:hypothetical protein